MLVPINKEKIKEKRYGIVYLSPEDAEALLALNPDDSSVRVLCSDWSRPTVYDFVYSISGSSNDMFDFRGIIPASKLIASCLEERDKKKNGEMTDFVCFIRIVEFSGHKVVSINTGKPISVSDIESNEGLPVILKQFDDAFVNNNLIQ